jgi:hypothetical protein
MRKDLPYCLPGQPRSGWATLPASCKYLTIVVLFLLTSLGGRAQTTVFNETFEGATSSFATANGTQTNRWFVGTAGGNGPTTTGTKAAFISNDGGISSAYTITSPAVSHLYRDVTFPAGQNIFQLSFDWKAGGESTYDYLQVFVISSTVIPPAGTQLGVAGDVQIGGNINLQSAFGRTTLTLPSNLAGTTQRLVFSWRNDLSFGTQPGAVIDNITVTAQAAAPLSGAYTINNALPTAGTNFASFTDAASRLNLDGISGPTTLTVSGGPYTEQFLLDQVVGTSATNRLTVNGGGRTIRFASSNAARRAVVQLNGTDYTTINNLVIDATGGTSTPGTYGYGILLANAADNDHITNNVVTTDVASTSSNFVGIAVNGLLTSATTSGVPSSSNVIIEGNTVTGGFYGITLVGNTATSLNVGNEVRNNTVRDFYFYGIYSGYQDGAQFIGNDISRPLRTSTNGFYGIYSFGNSRSQAIEKNRLHDPFAGNLTSFGQVYGIYLSTGGGATATTPNDVVNNLLYNLNGGMLQYAIYNAGAANTRIYNNTISSEDQAANTTDTYGIYSSGTNADVKNNTISLSRASTGAKYGLYYTVATTASNYNAIYAPNGNVGYYGVAFPTLASWQAANSAAFDQNSVSTDPYFVSPATGNLAPSNALLNNVGTPLVRVTEDITGAMRGTAPDPGAYEFGPVATDLAPASLAGPAVATSCYSPAEAIIVQIRNAGSATIDFASAAATVTVVATPPTGTAQTFTTTVSTGTLASGATQNVTLPGTLNMSALGTYSFAISTTLVGDLNASNNTLAPAPTRTVVAPVAGTLSPGTNNLCFSGTATLNLTGAANGTTQFQSSTSATGTFTDVAGATAATFTTPVLTSTMYYRVRATCNTNTVYSTVATVTVNSPTITAAPAITICAGLPAPLSATTASGTSVRFYTAATGGTTLGTTNPFVTGPLTASTTFYAEPFISTMAVAGLTSNSAASGTFSQSFSTDYPLGFAVTEAGTLTSVDVYPTAAGTLTIRLYQVSGTQPSGTATAVSGSDVTITVTAAQVGTRVTVPVNYALTAGDYKLSNAVGGLGRYGTYTGTYPLMSPGGILTVKGSYSVASSTVYSNTNYNSFFNLTFTSECVGTTRTPVPVTVTPGLVATLPVTTVTNCGATPYQLAGTIAGTATGATYTSSGTGTFAPNATTLNATYTPSAADVTAGTVTLTLTPTGPTTPCTQAAQVVLTLVRPPVATFSYPTGTYCTGAATSVTPVLATGAGAGTFSTTGGGLRLDPMTGVINLITQTVTGTYTVTNTVPATAFCSAVTATATITISAGLSTPTLLAVALSGGGVQLSTTPVSTVLYQFFVNGVAVGPPSTAFSVTVSNAPANGNYTVVLSVPGGCASAPSTPVLVTANATATLNGVGLRVYPNPSATGLLTVELNGAKAQTSQLTVLNSIGQIVHTGKAVAGPVALNLAHLATGVYTLRVQTSEGVLTQRIVRD